MRLKQDGDHDILKYAYAILKKQGRSFDNCEECKRPLSGLKWGLHHTKYEGATIYDLRIVCQRCNTQPDNRYLS